MAAKNMFLFWGSGSIPCWKAMIALEEKGFQGYGNKLISFDNEEQKCDEIVKLNPRAQVPTFKDGDLVINESGAICDYLEYRYRDQGTRLLPDDPVQRGKVLQRVQEAQNLFRFVIENVAYYYYYTKPEDIDEDYLNTKKKEARDELQRWENYLKLEGNGSYVVGSTFTMADILVFPNLAFGVRSKLNLDPFPFLKAYYLRLKDRPSIKASWPPHWEGTEGQDLYKGV